MPADYAYTEVPDQILNRPRIWQVGALCRAIADALDAKFNPVSVLGEISGFSRASSGHCYFSLKDATGQLRCAMFRRAASLLDFSPQDGELVEVRGKLSVYEARGELQMVVESMSRAGQGALFEQFLKLKAKLQAQGLFDSESKRQPVAMPRGIGLVTSLGAAALHDVVSALQRRVPHIPVVLAPAAVQGSKAPAEICQALSNLYHLYQQNKGLEADLTSDSAAGPIDVILLVRGGGALEDLWAFNDESVAQCMAQSPVPIITGVGHETDFTIADFVADLRAPTPTAAAELVALPQSFGLSTLDKLQDRLVAAMEHQMDGQAQTMDVLAARLGRPSMLVARQHPRLDALRQHLRASAASQITLTRSELQRQARQWSLGFKQSLDQAGNRLERAKLRLELLDPALVLQRGYVWLSDDKGQTISRISQTHPGQSVHATLVDGGVDLVVESRRLI